MLLLLLLLRQLNALLPTATPIFSHFTHFSSNKTTQCY
jgi:hypothetical protein